MAKTKASDGQRTRAVRKRSQHNQAATVLTQKRDAVTGRVMDVSTSGGDFKGVRHEKKGGFLARVQSMTTAEFRASLLSAGIITKSGELAMPYRG